MLNTSKVFNLLKHLNRKNILEQKGSRLFSSSTEASVLKLKNDVNKTSRIPDEYRKIYREFLPDPKIEWRNPIKERLEREDMLARRENINIPEFYVGSVLAVTSSDSHAAGKTSKFVGICIDRERCGLRARFILRNVLEHQAVEILFDMYDPTMQKIEVLRLEKRLDDKLFYLRDALPIYSTFNVNMEPETLPEGSAVPVNEIKVKLKSRPWLEKWERQNLQGVENIDEHIYEIHRKRAIARATPWEKYDLMKEYRRSLPETDQKIIFANVFTRLQLLQTKNSLKKRALKPIKLA